MKRWTATNPTWELLSDNQKGAVMSIMEVGIGNYGLTNYLLAAARRAASSVEKFTGDRMACPNCGGDKWHISTLDDGDPCIMCSSCNYMCTDNMMADFGISKI